MTQLADFSVENLKFARPVHNREMSLQAPSSTVFTVSDCCSTPL